MLSSSRADEASPVWICCCCGCLPVLGLVKALLFGPLPVLIVCLGCTSVTLGCLFHDIFLVYEIVWTTSLLGRNIRVVTLLTLPVLLLIWPFVVFLTTLLGGLFYFFSVIAGSVFDGSVPLLGGWWGPIKDAVHWVVWWWRHNVEGVFRLAAHIRGIPRGWDGQVYDIHLVSVFCSVGLILWGTAVGGAGVITLATLKLVPALLRALYEYVLLLKALQPWWWLFWLCGLTLVVVACPLVYGLVVCYGLASGPRCAVEALSSASVASGFLEVARILREFDLGTNMFIFRKEVSCVPSVRERPTRQDLSQMFLSRPEDSLNGVWDLFFEECERTTRRALLDNWLLSSSIDSLDPSVIIGVPALCAFDTLYRSEVEAPGVQCIRWPAIVCEEKSRPRGSISNAFWPKIMACKEEIAKRLPLLDGELLYLRVKLCTGGGDMDGLGQTARTLLSQQLPRQPDLHALCAEFTRLSLELSRLGQMRRRFPAMLAAVAATTVVPPDVESGPPAEGMAPVQGQDGSQVTQGHTEAEAQVLGRPEASLKHASFEEFVASLTQGQGSDEESAEPVGTAQGTPDLEGEGLAEVALPGFIQVTPRQS